MDILFPKTSNVLVNLKRKRTDTPVYDNADCSFFKHNKNQYVYLTIPDAKQTKLLSGRCSKIGACSVSSRHYAENVISLLQLGHPHTHECEPKYEKRATHARARNGEFPENAFENSGRSKSGFACSEGNNSPLLRTTGLPSLEVFAIPY
jgi:hypothetical protein